MSEPPYRMKHGASANISARDELLHKSFRQLKTDGDEKLEQ